MSRRRDRSTAVVETRFPVGLWLAWNPRVSEVERGRGGGVENVGGKCPPRKYPGQQTPTGLETSLWFSL